MKAYDDQRNTALHEAAHIVSAYLSRFHSLTGDICLESELTAATFVTLSRSKVVSEGRDANVNYNNLINDPEIAFDKAVILYSGYEAERKYCQMTNIEPSDEYSKNDFNDAEESLNNTNQFQNISFAKETSKLLVEKYWEPIDNIADIILKSNNKCIEALTAIDYLNKGFEKNKTV